MAKGTVRVGPIERPPVSTYTTEHDPVRRGTHPEEVPMFGRLVMASCLVLASVRPGSGQALFPLSLPLASQAATVSQRIGLTDLSIAYHRPGVGGRTVW